MTTNFERIKNMTVEEMARYFSNNKEFLYALGIGLRAAINEHWNGKAYMSIEKQDKIQVAGMKEWLEQESEE